MALSLADDALRRLSRHDAADIHEIRKRLKELRAILRAADDLFPAARDARHQLREAGRGLAAARDREALLALLDKLSGAPAASPAPEPAVAPLRALIAAESPSIDIGTVHAQITRARTAIAAWPSDRHPDLNRALRRSRRAARKRMRAAARLRTAASFHEWRKRTKEHWYVLRIAGVTADSEKALHQLARMLGEHHDLDLLRQRCLENGDRLGPAAALQFWTSVTTRMHALEEEALALKASLFRESMVCA